MSKFAPTRRLLHAAEEICHILSCFEPALHPGCRLIFSFLRQPISSVESAIPTPPDLPPPSKPAEALSLKLTACFDFLKSLPPSPASFEIQGFSLLPAIYNKNHDRQCGFEHRSRVSPPVFHHLADLIAENQIETVFRMYLSLFIFLQPFASLLAPTEWEDWDSLASKLPPFEIEADLIGRISPKVFAKGRAVNEIEVRQALEDWKGMTASDGRISLMEIVRFVKAGRYQSDFFELLVLLRDRFVVQEGIDVESMMELLENWNPPSLKSQSELVMEEEEDESEGNEKSEESK
jgi:hypothetical protein